MGGYPFGIYKYSYYDGINSLTGETALEPTKLNIFYESQSTNIVKEILITIKNKEYIDLRPSLLLINQTNILKENQIPVIEVDTVFPYIYTAYSPSQGNIKNDNNRIIMCGGSKDHMDKQVQIEIKEGYREDIIFEKTIEVTGKKSSVWVIDDIMFTDTNTNPQNILLKENTTTDYWQLLTICNALPGRPVVTNKQLNLGFIRENYPKEYTVVGFGRRVQTRELPIEVDGSTKKEIYMWIHYKYIINDYQEIVLCDIVDEIDLNNIDDELLNKSVRNNMQLFKNKFIFGVIGVNDFLTYISINPVMLYNKEVTLSYPILYADGNQVNTIYNYKVLHDNLPLNLSYKALSGKIKYGLILYKNSLIRNSCNLSSINNSDDFYTVPEYNFLIDTDFSQGANSTTWNHNQSVFSKKYINSYGDAINENGNNCIIINDDKSLYKNYYVFGTRGDILESKEININNGGNYTLEFYSKYLIGKIICEIYSLPNNTLYKLLPAFELDFGFWKKNNSPYINLNRGKYKIIFKTRLSPYEDGLEILYKYNNYKGNYLQKYMYPTIAMITNISLYPTQQPTTTQQPITQQPITQQPTTTQQPTLLQTGCLSNSKLSTTFSYPPFSKIFMKITDIDDSCNGLVNLTDSDFNNQTSTGLYAMGFLPPDNTATLSPIAVTSYYVAYIWIPINNNYTWHQLTNQTASSTFNIVSQYLDRSPSQPLTLLKSINIRNYRYGFGYFNNQNDRLIHKTNVTTGNSIQLGIGLNFMLDNNNVVYYINSVGSVFKDVSADDNLNWIQVPNLPNIQPMLTTTIKPITTITSKFYSPNTDFAIVTGPDSYVINNNGYIYSKEYLSIENNGILIEIANIFIDTIDDYLFVGVENNIGSFTGLKITNIDRQYNCMIIYENKYNKTINQNFSLGTIFSIYYDKQRNVYFYADNNIIESSNIKLSEPLYRFVSFGKATRPITVSNAYFNNGLPQYLKLPMVQTTTYQPKPNIINLPLFNNIFNQNTNNNTPSGQILSNIGSINYLNSVRIIGGLNASLNTTFTLYIWINPSVPVFQITEKIISYNFDMLIPVNIQINTPGYYISLKLNNIGSITINQLLINYS